MIRIKHVPAAAKYSFKHPMNRISGIALLATLAAAFLISAGLWMPVKLEYDSRVNKLKNINSMIAREKTAQRILSVYAESEKKVSNVEKRLERSLKPGELIAQINNLAKKSGLKVAVENNSRRGISSLTDTQTQEIAATGSYRGVREFIYGIEHLDSYVVINKIRIERGGKGGESMKCVMNVAAYSGGAK